MAILRIRDNNGRVHEILALRGEPGKDGKDGTVSFDELTDAQKEELAGMIGNFTVDQTLDEKSTNAVSNSAVAMGFINLNNVDNDLNERLTALDNDLHYQYDEFSAGIAQNKSLIEETKLHSERNEQEIVNLSSGVGEAHIRINEVEQQLGGVETALDSIITIQNGLIGGASV